MPVEGAFAGRRILLVVPPEGFAEEELREVREVLAARGATVEVGSTVPRARGTSGTEEQVDATIAGADPRRYVAVVVLGGRGAPGHLWESGPLHALLRLARADGAVIGALALGTPVLARAGLLEGIHATTSGAVPRAKFELTHSGALYLAGDTVSDRGIVTGAGSHTAGTFAAAVAAAIEARAGTGR